MSHPRPWKAVVRDSDWGEPDSYMAVEDANGIRVCVVATYQEAEAIIGDQQPMIYLVTKWEGDSYGHGETVPVCYATSEGAALQYVQRQPEEEHRLYNVHDVKHHADETD